VHRTLTHTTQRPDSDKNQEDLFERNPGFEGVGGGGGAVRRDGRDTHPYVDLGPGVVFPPENLGSGVRRATAPRAQSFAGSESVAEAKVGDLDVHLGIEKQVLRLEIPMRHTRHMAVLDRGQYLGEGGACPGLSHSSVARYVVEYLAFARVLAHL